jgi:hypothetical protein
VLSIRNAQRLLDRIGQLASGDRVRLLLNRAAEPFPIPPAQIEKAAGHPIFQTFLSDYKTVSTALNSGVPLAGDSRSLSVQPLPPVSWWAGGAEAAPVKAPAAAKRPATSTVSSIGDPMASHTLKPPPCPLAPGRPRLRARCVELKATVHKNS